MNYYDIRVQNSMYSIQILYYKNHAGKLSICTEFHHANDWTDEQKSQLIESLMLHIPIMPLFFTENADGHTVVLDGIHRLTSIFEFLDEKFCLEKLVYLKEYEHCVFSELPKKYRTQILGTQLQVYELDGQCGYAVKNDFFRRINTCGISPTVQEIRTILTSKRVRKILKKMSSSKEFLRVVKRGRKKTDLELQELCLYYLLYNQIYHERERMTDSINLNYALDTMMDILDHTDNSIEYMYDDFCKTMEKCYALLGETSLTANKALFAVWGVFLKKLQISYNELEAKRNYAVTLQKKYLGSERYKVVFGKTAETKEDIELQFGMVQRILEDLDL